MVLHSMVDFERFCVRLLARIYYRIHGAVFRTALQSGRYAGSGLVNTAAINSVNRYLLYIVKNE
jgi:hypothetical protein